MSDAIERRGLVAAALAALLLAAVPAWAEEAAGGSPAFPEGTADASAAPEEQHDPIFDEDFEDDFLAPVYDPWESGNRLFFGVNEQLDRFFWEPLTRGYQFVVPAPARRSLRRVVTNLTTPVYVVNNLLQLRFRDAGETLVAFAMNSTIGAAGLFDAGKEVGMEYQKADFGQTLGMYGVGSGPYLVVPLLGPSNVRDGLGDLVDRGFQPMNYILGPLPQILWGGGLGLARRDENHEELKVLQSSAVDFYSVLRSAYMQSRIGAIQEARRRSLLDFDEEPEPDAAEPTREAAEPAVSVTP